MAYDFPASPSTGQVYQGWTYDGEKWLGTAVNPNTAGVIGIQVFKTSGFYVPSPSMTSCVIECVGGGGGGAAITGSANYSQGAGGGGSGAYSRSVKTAAQIGTSQTITVGAGGASGTNGVSTTVGIMLSAGGGSAGSGWLGGVGGVVGTGDLAVTGTVGGNGQYSNPAVGITMSGIGGASAFGGGGSGTTSGNPGVATGLPGVNGGGGGGGVANNTTSSAAGAAGGSGIVVITEYGMTALAAGAAQGNVRYDLPQGLTASQMAQARANIGDVKRNYIINGAMQINQGGYISAAVLAAAAYGHDQWKAGASGGDYSFTQSTGSTTITVAAGKSLIQPIEDVRVVGGGSYVLSWTGTAQARAGVNTLTPAGSYAASPLLITGQTDGTVMSVEFNAGTLGNVGLYEGSVAPPFMVPDYASELALCMRYFEPCRFGTVGGYQNAAGYLQWPYPFKTVKRAAPTFSAFAWTATGNAQGQLATDVSVYGVSVQIQAIAAGTAYFSGLLSNASARL